MKHASNYMPFEDQCEGWLELKRHKVGNLPLSKKIIVVNSSTQNGDIYSAFCIRQEQGCSYMVTEDGRPFRITEHSRVQAYSALFTNTTDTNRAGSKIGNFWLNIANEWQLKWFLKGDAYRIYILWDNTEKQFEPYPQKEERSDIVWAGVGRGFMQTHVNMTDKGFTGG